MDNQIELLKKLINNGKEEYQELSKEFSHSKPIDKTNENLKDWEELSKIVMGAITLTTKISTPSSKGKEESVTTKKERKLLKIDKNVIRYHPDTIQKFIAHKESLKK